MDLNFNALFDSPFVGGILAQAAAFDPTTPTAGQLAAVFENSTLRVEQWIGLEDGFVHRTLVDLALNINPQALNLQGNRGTIALTFDVTLDAFNETVSITAPEDAFVLSAETPTTTDTPASPVAAQPITANTPTIVELTGQGAVDLTYMAPGAETINVTARSVVANTVDPTVEVIGPDGQTLAFNDDHSPSVTDGNLGAFDSAIQDLALPGAGAYTIRVGSYNNSGLGEVEVLVESAASSVAPPALAESEIVPGSLASGGTFAYSFTANAGETITLAARDLSNTLDPSLLLMDSQFNRVAENDDHASDDPALDQHDPKIQDFVIPADGVYNVLVSDDAGGEGAFQLVIIRGGGRVSDFAELEPASVAAIEPPADDPDAMRLGEAITLNLDGESAAARNFYGAAGQEITITARAVNPPDMDIYLTVFAPNGAQIAFNDDHWSGDTSLGQRDARIQTLTLPSDGAYRIEVDSWFDLSGEVAVEVEEG